VPAPLHSYSYALNNPIDILDPDGLSPLTLAKRVVGAGIRQLRAITRGQALRGLKRGGDVKAESRAIAKKLAKDYSKNNGGCGKVSKHLPEEPKVPHYHGLGPNGDQLPGHIFFDFLMSILDSNGNGEILDAEDVFDLFNPIPGLTYQDYFPSQPVNPYCPGCI